MGRTDHLPSLVAREASEAFPSLLVPCLRVLDKRDQEGVWVRAEKLFPAREHKSCPLLHGCRKCKGYGERSTTRPE